VRRAEIFDPYHERIRALSMSGGRGRPDSVVSQHDGHLSRRAARDARRGAGTTATAEFACLVLEGRAARRVGGV